MIHPAVLLGLVGVLLLPRAARGWHGLAVIAVFAVVATLIGWFGWAAGLPHAVDRAAVLLVTLPVLATLTLGLTVRAVVLGRHWPPVPDAGLTLGAAMILAVAYLKLFDLV